MTKKKLHEIRREYGLQSLTETTIHPDPMQQFQRWFDDVLNTHKVDPTAMVLATVDRQGLPDTRVVLLKDILEGCFIFYTNYDSAKAQQIENNSFVALNFYWSSLSRQVRVRGQASKITEELSDFYFSSRPRASQLSALASPQSEIIASRKDLENQVEQLTVDYEDRIINRPKNWGGYQVKPFELEFWQGRDNRLHDRLRYIYENDRWRVERLAP